MEENVTVSWTEIMKFVGSGLRPYKEGESVLEGKHVICCGIKCRNLNCFEIFALCLQSSSLTSPPHKIEVVFNAEESAAKISRCHCSCQAGNSGHCKHIVAVLMLINRQGINSLDDLSCTDLERQWGKLKKTAGCLYDPKPFIELCHVKHTASPYDTVPLIPHDSQRSEILYQRFAKAAPCSESAIFSSQSRIQSVSSQPAAEESSNSMDVEEHQDHQSRPSTHVASCVMKIINKNAPEEMTPRTDSQQFHDKDFDFYMKNVHVTPNKSVSICEDTVEQEGPTWLLERRNRITGSSCYSLHTYYVNKAPDWSTKILTLLNPKFKGNTFTRHGNLNEPKAKVAYLAATGIAISELGLVVNPKSPWLGYSPDGVIMGNDNVEKLIEIKCPIMGLEKSAREVSESVKFLKNNKLKKKHPYYGQVQLGMFVLNTLSCDFLVYSPFDNSLWVTIVPYDQDFLSVMLPRLEEIYFKHVLPRLAAE